MMWKIEFNVFGVKKAYISPIPESHIKPSANTGVTNKKNNTGIILFIINPTAFQPPNHHEPNHSNFHDTAKAIFQNTDIH